MNPLCVVVVLLALYSFRETNAQNINVYSSNLGGYVNVTSVREALDTLQITATTTDTAMLKFSAGVYSGLDNVRQTFLGSKDSYWLISAQPGENVTIDCEGQNWGWHFSTKAYIRIYGGMDEPYGFFTFKNCTTTEDHVVGGALTSDGAGGSIQSTTFSHNRGNGSAIYVRNAMFSINDYCEFRNNSGIAVMLQRSESSSSISATVSIQGDSMGYSEDPVLFEGNEQNVYCSGLGSQYNTLILLTYTTINKVDCCKNCYVLAGNTPIGCTCGSSSSSSPPSTPDGFDGSFDESDTDNEATSSDDDSKRNNGTALGVGLGIGLPVVICGVAAVVGFFLYSRRTKKGQGEQHPLTENSKSTTPGYVGIEVKADKQPKTETRESHSAPDWEIDYESITFEVEIGRGAFGRVYRANWRAQEVAVKQLIDVGMTPDRIKEFNSEAGLMMKLRPHKNCLQLYGVCRNPDKPLCIVMEYLPTGSLRTLLDSPKELTDQQFMQMAVDIASGCFHLHCEKITHRDLACRNLLLDEYYRVKVADYGLARANMSNATANLQIPLRWSAPEVIKKNEFSFASDVWSFGVILYEIWSRNVPYYENTNSTEVAMLVANRKLSLVPPTNMPQGVADLMKRCLEYDYNDRPNFKQILMSLKQLSVTEEEQQNIDVQINIATANVYAPMDFTANSYAATPNGKNYSGLPGDSADTYGNSAPIQGYAPPSVVQNTPTPGTANYGSSS